MKGPPQRPDPTKPGLNIPVRIRIEPEVPFDMPVMRPARDEDGPRRACSMKRHYEEHGYTEGCEACARLSAGMKGSPHSNVCRGRMYRELKKTEEGRKWMTESEARIDEYLNGKVRKDHEEKDEAERKERQAQMPNEDGGKG